MERRNEVLVEEPDRYPVDYGYLWWLLRLDGTGPTGTIYTAASAMGQWIVVIPKYDVVIAVTAGTEQFDLPAPRGAPPLGAGPVRCPIATGRLDRSGGAAGQHNGRGQRPGHLTHRRPGPPRAA
ncbi:MAG: hypothetical protein ABI647_01430 [Gemmatimonadota bacterium]